MTHNRSRHRGQRGVATIWFVFLFTTLLTFVVLAIDVLWISLNARRLSAGADSSALAGALWVRRSPVTVRDAAVAFAAANTAGKDPIVILRNDTNNPSGDLIIGRYHRPTATFTPTESNPNAVWVRAPRTADAPSGSLPLLLAPIFGIDVAQIDRHAVAMIRGDLGAGVIALNPHDKCTFDLRGTSGSFIVDGGAIVVNSDHADAACHAGQPSLQAGELHVHGETDKNFESKVSFDGELIENSEPVPDPLAELPDPVYDVNNPIDADEPFHAEGGETIVVTQPGYYKDGFSVNNGRMEINTSGVYILDGVGLDVNGGDLVVAEGVGVMFYIIDTTPDNSPDSRVNLRGNGDIVIRALDPDLHSDDDSIEQVYVDAQVTIFQARENLHDSRILGTNQFNAEGTWYFPNSHIEIGGTSNSFGWGLIADTIQAHGDGDLIIDYHDQFPRLPRSVFLVE